LLDLLFDCRCDVREQQARFVKKENQLRLFRIANFLEDSRTTLIASKAEMSSKPSVIFASTCPQQVC
jgi:hypothetical protein